MQIPSPPNNNPVSFVGALNNTGNTGTPALQVSHSYRPPPVSATLLWNQRSGEWAVEFHDQLHGKKSVGIHPTSAQYIADLSKEKSLQASEISVHTTIDNRGQSSAIFGLDSTSIRMDTASFEQRENMSFADFIRAYQPVRTQLSFQHLPAELKFDILDQLSFTDKKNLRLVKTTWYPVATVGLTPQLKIDRKDNLGNLDQVLRGMPGLYRLNVNKISLRDADTNNRWVTNAEIRKIALVLKEHRHITEFDAGGCRKVSDSVLGALTKVSHLQKLGLSGCNLTHDAFRHFRRKENSAQPFPQVSHLDVSRCTRIRNLSNVDVLPALKHLYLDGCERLDDVSALQDMDLATLSAESVRSLGNQLAYLNHMQNLKSLNLNSCYPPEDQLQHLQNLTNLERLNLSGARMSPSILQLVGALHKLKDLRLAFAVVSAAPVDHLEPLSKTLEKLDLGFLYSADVNRGRLGSLSTFSQLTALNLPNTAHGLSEELSEVGQLKKLTYLNISSWPDLTDTMLAEYILPLQNLTCLALNNCTQLSEAGIRLCKQLPELETLCVSGCNISARFLSELQEAIPNVITEWVSTPHMP